MSFQENVLDFLNLKDGDEIQDGAICARSNNKLI